MQFDLLGSYKYSSYETTQDSNNQYNHHAGSCLCFQR